MMLRDRLATPAELPLVMGVLNATPDSFSDGGKYATASSATTHARTMIAQGADIIDVGPESTRPGAAEVPAEEQIARAVPVIAAIRAENPAISISIDTRFAAVARAALDAGADMVNDVSALRDDRGMVDVVASSGAAVVLMHRRGTPSTMQREGGPYYDDVIETICTFLQERVQYAAANGVDRSRIIVDPGIGFGKRVENNLTILRCLDRIVALGKPVLIGASRKSFLGTVLGIDRPAERQAGSLACAVVAALAGVAILRVHDVRATVEAVRVCRAIRSANRDFQNGS